MTPMKIAIIVGKMDSGGKKNLIMEYYRHIDRDKIQFDFICDSDSQAIPEQEILELEGAYIKFHLISILYGIWLIWLVFSGRTNIRLFMLIIVR